MKPFATNLLAVVLAALLLLSSGFVLAQQSRSDMIAVAASNKTPSASVSSQAGRSPFFLLFDKQGTFVEAVDNPYKDAGNAGIPTLDFLAGKGVKVLVAEGFGSRIVEVMKSKGIRPVEFKGNAQDAVKKALELK
jgi:predicted Fe-Mo cluster-binding NifX family protein